MNNRRLTASSVNSVPDWVIQEQILSLKERQLFLVSFVDNQPSLGIAMIKAKSSVRSNFFITVATLLESKLTNQTTASQISLFLLTNEQPRFNFIRNTVYWEKWWDEKNKRYLFTVYLRSSIVTNRMYRYLQSSIKRYAKQKINVADLFTVQQITN